MDAFKDRFISFAKEHFVAVLVGVCGLVFLVYGFVSLYYVGDTEEDIVFASKESDQASASKQENPEKQKVIMVDIAGAVAKPGVYNLPSDSRVQDLILAAGGISPNADRQKVAQTLNLAAPLTDGAKLYIPIVGEQMVTSSGGSENSSAASQSTLGSTTALININTAETSALEELPGVGEVTAGKIIENRPYASVEELLEKKAVGEATFEKIKDQVSVF
jgi:competence protein ComEA